MKFGLLTAILDGMSFEEVVAFAAENNLECLEVACWPASGGAKRRYAGVCHIDAERVCSDKDYAAYVKGVADFAGVEISSLGYYPNTMDPDLAKRKTYVDHIHALIDASAILGVNMVTTFLGRNVQYNVRTAIGEFVIKAEQGNVYSIGSQVTLELSENKIILIEPQTT